MDRRKFLKTSLSTLAFAALPKISFAQSNPDVVVIGAGSAGLSATAELMQKGVSVLCIEAMNRTGGRCYADTTTFGVPIDIGGHWLHGFSENQFAKFGKKHKDKFKIYPEDAPSIVYDGKRKTEATELWKIYKELKRIRYTTSHPKDVSEDLINCYKDCEKLMPFLHLPIQSGSDRILKLMNRKHNIKYYIEIIEKLKMTNKNIKFSSDFIIGYPGETEQDYQDTINFVKKIGFINSYSFIFSSRPGTPAASMKVNDLEISKKRLKNLQNTLKNLQFKNNKMYLNEFCQVLVENKLSDQEKYFGRTKFMTPVIFGSDNCKNGDIVNIKITSFNKNNLFGFHKTNNNEKAA